MPVTMVLPGRVRTAVHLCLQTPVWGDTEPKAVPQAKLLREAKFGLQVNNVLCVQQLSPWESRFLGRLLERVVPKGI